MASYPQTLTYLRLTVDGTERTDELISKTLRIHKVLGAQVDTCDFSLKGKESWRGTAGDKPAEGQTVTVEQRIDTTGSWEKIFGGEVQNVNEERFGQKAFAWRVSCVDYTKRLQRVLVNETYVDLSVSDIVRDVVERFAPFVSSSGIQDASLVVRTAWTFSRQYAADVIQRLAELVGYEWWVNEDSVLYFVDPNSLGQVAAQSLTDSSNNFNRLTVEPQLSQVRNRVFAYSDNVLTDEIVDEHHGDGVLRVFQLRYPRVTADLSRFMTIDGVAARVILKGVADETNYDNGATYQLDAAAGQLANLASTPTIRDTAQILFRYRAVIPGGVVREDRTSQATIAALEGTDYSSVVLADAPLYYYRLNETTGTAAANSGTAGLAASGMWVGTRKVVAGPLTGDQGVAVSLPGTSGPNLGNYLRLSRAAVMPSGSYTLEAFVNTTKRYNVEGGGGTPVIGGIISRMNFDTNRGAALRTVGTNSGADPFEYYVTHGPGATSPPTGVTVASGVVIGGAWEHVVATYDNTTKQHRLYRNKRLLSQVSANAPGYVGVSGILIGSHDPSNDPDTPATVDFYGLIAEPAIYNTALSPQRVAAHYDAAVYGGVRERILVDNELQTLDQLQRAAEKEISRYGSVLTDVSFVSNVPSWDVGTRLTINLTQANTGRTVSLTPLIQQVDINSIGTQRVEYRVSAVETRFNIMDYYHQVARLKQVSSAAPITQVQEFESTVIIIGAVPQVTTI